MRRKFLGVRLPFSTSFLASLFFFLHDFMTMRHVKANLAILSLACSPPMYHVETKALIPFWLIHTLRDQHFSPAGSSNFSDLVVKHLVRGATVPITHLVCCCYACNRYTVFNLAARRWTAPLWQWVREGKVFGQETNLPQDAALVPRNVLVIESIATNIYHSCERNLDPLVRGRDAWQTTECQLLSTMVKIKVGSYIQSII